MKHFYLLVALLLFIVVGSNVNAQNKPKGSISGNILDGNTSLPGATVALKETKFVTVTDIDGKFTLTSIPEGNYTLVVTYLGYNELSKNITVTGGQDLALKSLQLQPKAVDMNVVTVKGELKHGSEFKAINMIKTSPKVLNVISSENIVKLPDKNAAEVVQRIPGAAVQKDKGEGSFVALRGTPTDWTATLINGDRMPVADEENTSRTFEFEVLPSDLIDYVVVSKSITPDIEGDNIGGSINFITKTAVDQRTLNINVAGGYNLLARKPTMSLNVLWGDRSKNKRFGYVANVSYFGRYYAAQDYKVVYGSNYNQGINRLELKDYNGFRNTLGANFAAEYQVAERSKIYAKVLYGGMMDDKYQQKTMYNWTEGSGSSVRLQNLHGVLQRQLICGQIGGDFTLNDKLKLTVNVGSYHNRFQYGPYPFGKGDARNGYNVIEFARYLLGQDRYTDQDYVDLYGNPVDISNGIPSTAFLTKLIGSDNPYGRGDDYRNIQPQTSVVLKPEDFVFSQAYSELNRTIERDPVVAAADLSWNITNNYRLQVGGKARMKTGSRELGLYKWIQNTPVFPGNIVMTNYALAPFDEKGGYLRELGSPYKGTFMPFLTRDQQASFIKQLGDTLLAYPPDYHNLEYLDFVGSSYHYREYAFAGYAMLEAKVTKKVTIVGGLRLEETMLQEFADTIDPNLVQDTVSHTFYFPTIEREADNNYLAILPAITTTYAITDKMNLKGAFSRTFHRPNFAESKPGFPQYSYENLEFNFGNPNLKPTYSYNFDLMYEYYWGNKGMFSVGGYYKYVTDHIFAVMTADDDPSTGIIYKSYQNAEKSYVVGAEVSFVKQFDFLPKFWGGFGLMANFTYSYSRMHVPGRTIDQPMPEQTPILYNIALFYEKYGFSTRLALNYTGSYLLELNLAAVKGLDGSYTLLHQNTDFDVFQNQNYSLDYQASYEFKKHFTVYVEFNNLLDYPYVIYRGKRERPITTEYYRQHGQIGFKYSF